MNVRQLIEELKKYPDDTELYCMNFWDLEAVQSLQKKNYSGIEQGKDILMLNAEKYLL